MGAMLSGLFRLFKGRIFPPIDPTTSLEDKTVLITGANTGLGFQAAIKYLNLGASTVIIGCRDLQRGNQAKARIERLTGRTGAVHVWPLDMSTYESVVGFTERVDQEIPRLDIALLNSGVLHRTYTSSPEGWENTIQVNTISTVLLALLLLPKLRANRTDTGPANLTVTSSGLHRFVKLQQLEDSTDEPVLQHVNKVSNFGGMQYRVSKILLEFALREIARLTRHDNGTIDVIVNSACPGLCNTDLNREYNSFTERLLNPIFYLFFGRSAEQGSRTLVSATLLGEESHGRCWTHDSFPDLSGHLICSEVGKRLQQKVWHEIISELNTQFPNIEHHALLM